MSDEERDAGIRFGLRATGLVLLIALVAFVGSCVVTTLMDRIK